MFSSKRDGFNDSTMFDPKLLIRKRYDWIAGVTKNNEVRVRKSEQIFPVQKSINE